MNIETLQILAILKQRYLIKARLSEYAIANTLKNNFNYHKNEIALNDYDN